MNRKIPDKYNTFIVFGAPGSGKGTQGAILGRIPRMFHFACGDAFRSMDTRTEIGQEFLRYSSEGKLVPDEVTVRFWKAQINNQVEAHVFKPDIDFLVLDGIPRNLKQAQIMDEYVNVIRLFHLSVPDRNELTRRLRKRALKDNRLDDASDEVIAKRVKTYEEESKALLKHYPKGIITEIDAAQPPVKVLSCILNDIMKLPEWEESLKVIA
ncbi:MAG: nucleoside monophosphate kinase [Verrucomicrobia bacterium]|nr:nucleoside monophosphate kinase [Verrucomicrobiota bacterium]